MKALATILSLIFLAAPISNALAGAGAAQRAQARAHKAADQWNKQQREMWKKFDADMTAAARQWEPSSGNMDLRTCKAFVGKHGLKICLGERC
ncbi:MAG: hypothetical protein RDU20_03250 [Desulfomonilaceae bacterium]|nr:hypothetical protein [Desulfomonilaceae bacterium]